MSDNQKLLNAGEMLGKKISGLEIRHHKNAIITPDLSANSTVTIRFTDDTEITVLANDERPGARAIRDILESDIKSGGVMSDKPLDMSIDENLESSSPTDGGVISLDKLSPDEHKAFKERWDKVIDDWWKRRIAELEPILKRAAMTK